MSEGAVTVVFHRLRRGSGELLRAEIGRTVKSQEEIDEQLRYLLAVIRVSKDEVQHWKRSSH